MKTGQEKEKNMAKADIIKFQELLNSDAEFREKFIKAAEVHTGETDEKAVFDNLLLPFAQEYGLSATYEEFSEYIGAAGKADSELSEDELAQVAGGKGGGIGMSECLVLGFGMGAGGASTGDNWGGGVCALIGVGLGIFECIGSGESNHM